MHAYEDYVNRQVHLALVYGDIAAEAAPLVRVHVTDTIGDIIGVSDRRLGWPLRDAMRQIVEAGAGVIVLLRYPEGPRDLINAIRALDTVDGTNCQRPNCPAAGIMSCANTALVHKFCAILACDVCACCRRRCKCTRYRASVSRSWNILITAEVRAAKRGATTTGQDRNDGQHKNT